MKRTVRVYIPLFECHKSLQFRQVLERLGDHGMASDMESSGPRAYLGGFSAPFAPAEELLVMQVVRTSQRSGGTHHHTVFEHSELMWYYKHYVCSTIHGNLLVTSRSLIPGNWVSAFRGMH